MPKNCPIIPLHISISFAPIPNELGEVRTIFQTHPQSAHAKGLGDENKNADRKLPTHDVTLTAFTQSALAITFQPLASNQAQITTSSISK
jgi:hypothetical protein